MPKKLQFGKSANTNIGILMVFGDKYKEVLDHRPIIMNSGDRSGKSHFPLCLCLKNELLGLAKW